MALDIGAAGNARAIDHRVEAAESPLRLGNGGARRRLVGDVHGERHGAAFAGGDLARHLFRACGIAIGADHRGSQEREIFRRCLADAASRPHDQDGIAAVLRDDIIEAPDIPTHP